MCKKIFITATNTDIGKTYTTQLLLKSFAKKGYSVGVIKPIETGVVDSIYPDGELLLNTVKKLNSNFKTFTPQDIVPISYELPAAPFVASNAQKIDLVFLDTKIKEFENLCDILLIEGAGGLYVPIDNDMMMIDLIKHFNATALLVTHCSLGCINDTILSSNALKNNNIKHLITFNCKTEDKSFTQVSQPYFIKTKQNILKVDKDIDTICELLYNL